MYFYKIPTCKLQVARIFKTLIMSSSSEEELAELLRYGFIQRPRNFEERRLFDTENPREKIREKFRLSVDAFAHFLELINLRLENTLA